MKLKRASEVEMRGIEWLWPGRIPLKCITLIEGDPGTSKSTLSCVIAAHVSLGRDWPDGQPCPLGAAIMANAEDPESEVITPRLTAAKADLTKVSIIVPTDDNDTSMFTIPDNVDALAKEIVDMNVRVVIFDPLEAFLSTKVNNYSNHHVRQALHSLEAMAKKVNCSVIIVRHLNKDSGKAAIYRGGGSIGIIGAARASIMVAKDPTDKTRCLMVPNKGNWSAVKDGIAYKTVDTELVGKGGDVIRTSRIVWDGEVALDANAVLQPSSDMAEMTDLDDASSFIRTFLKDGPHTSGEVFSAAAAQGIAKKAIYRAARLINVMKHPEMEGGKQTWIWEIESEIINSEFLGTS